MGPSHHPHGMGPSHHPYSNTGGAMMSPAAHMGGAMGAPASNLSSNMQPSVRHSVVIQAEISGSINDFTRMGPGAATWKPVDGKHASIFGNRSFGNSMDVTNSDNNTGSSMMLNADLTHATNTLQNVSILSAELLQYYNNFPTPLGINVSCLPKNEVVDTGDRYTFTTVPNTSVSVPSVLYTAGDSQTQAALWRQEYPQYTATNIDTHQVLKLDNCQFMFVHETHPVINLLRMNKNILGTDIDTQPKMDNQWFKISNDLFQTSCDTLRNKVLNKMETANLMNLTITAVPVGKTDWDNFTNNDIMKTLVTNPSWDTDTLKQNKALHEATFHNKPNTFIARIRLDYEMLN